MIERMPLKPNAIAIPVAAAIGSSLLTGILLVHLALTDSPITARFGIGKACTHERAIIDANLIPGQFSEMTRFLDSCEATPSGQYPLLMMTGLRDRTQTAPLSDIANSPVSYWGTEKVQPLIVTIQKISQLSTIRTRVENDKTLTREDREKLAVLMDQAPHLIHNLRACLTSLKNEDIEPHNLEAMADEFMAASAKCATRLRQTS